MKIYHVFDHADPAETDCFLPTRREAERYQRDCKEPSDIQVLHIPAKPNREQICHALTWWPMR